MSANQNVSQNQNSQNQTVSQQPHQQMIPPQAPMQYPPYPYYPQQCQPQEEKEGIGFWTAVGIFGLGFLVGQIMADPMPESPQQGMKMPWQK